ncbi:hypothetical protein IHQ11_29900 [Priestia megaterium]|jgi:DNA-binding MarR family transcriptional regulator|uniref:hypothetical protein n=1 Tax=Priestia megaterium TaxID=1404 RepID=UPI001B3A6938|nr:hypothetical protein [Priestia megaterium]MBQ4870612.1 hypothetical protein [Priestia megaterium]
MKGNMKEYQSSQLAGIVGISVATVRKYAQYMEKAGYTFIRNESGHRIFLDEHILLFKEFNGLSKSGTTSLGHIANTLTTKYKELEFEKNAENEKRIGGEAASDTTLIDKGSEHKIALTDEQYTTLMAKLDRLATLDDIVEQLDQQKEFNKMLMEQLEQQQKYIEQRLDKRDSQLIESMRNSMDQRQAMIEAAVAKTPKNKWWEFWKL